MQKDIRELLKDYKEKEINLSANHANTFEDLLKKELHPSPKRKNYKRLAFAASIAILIVTGIQFSTTESTSGTIPNKQSPAKELSLGKISPEFNAIEKYYTNAINLEISELDLNDENKDLINGYLLKIARLTKDYKKLTQELNTKGVNEATIDALISNLQLRLQLFQRLKKQLKQFNNLNETTNESQII